MYLIATDFLWQIFVIPARSIVQGFLRSTDSRTLKTRSKKLQTGKQTKQTVLIQYCMSTVRTVYINCTPTVLYCTVLYVCMYSIIKCIWKNDDPVLVYCNPTTIEYSILLNKQCTILINMDNWRKEHMDWSSSSGHLTVSVHSCP